MVEQHRSGKVNLSQQEEELRLGWRMAGLAFTMASEAGAGALMGWLVDHFAGTAPTGLLGGSIAGIAVGLLSFVRGAFALNKLLANQDLSKIKPLPPPQEEEQEDNDDDWKD